MSINLSSLSNATTKATALSNLVLVSSQSAVGYQPQNPSSANNPLSLAQQPPKFLFNYEGEQTVAIESDITDHYIEDNTAIQDQIALKPEQITTHGFIGELNNIPPPALQLLKLAADKLTAVTAYAPQLTITSQLAYNNALLLYQVGASALNSAVSAWSSLGNLVTGSTGQTTIGTSIQTATNQNKQQQAFQLFYGYWKERRLFTVQTPWAVFQNMAIKSLRAIQDADTDKITDFEITFKMIRQASTSITTGGAAISLSGRAASQAAGAVNLGTSTPPASIDLSTALAAVV